jgi:hypothetical protein
MGDLLGFLSIFFVQRELNPVAMSHEFRTCGPLFRVIAVIYSKHIDFQTDRKENQFYTVITLEKWMFDIDKTSVSTIVGQVCPGLSLCPVCMYVCFGMPQELILIILLFSHSDIRSSSTAE